MSLFTYRDERDDDQWLEQERQRTADINELDRLRAEIEDAHKEADAATARYRKCDGYPPATLAQRVRDICLQLEHMKEAYRLLKDDRQ
jgi:hypothetical protein